MRRQAIAPGAADLLVVALDAFGQIVMQDKAHIRLVDAHAKGNGGDDDLGIVADEGFLVAAALVILQPGVIGADRVAVALQIGGQFIHLLAREAVDDAGLVFEALQEARGLDGGIAFGLNFDIQVLAVEAGDELIRLGKARGWT